jgi:hypothetical protein
MRELASSNITRFSHSESEHPPDGRLLVSGSDPRYPDYPQEYKHESFSPPVSEVVEFDLLSLQATNGLMEEICHQC